MNIIKRSGAEKQFSVTKIEQAVKKANKSVPKGQELSEDEIQTVVSEVTKECEELNRAIKVEEIQDMVEKSIMKLGAYEVAKNYVIYRYERTLARQGNTTDQQILSLVDCNNEEVKQENSNKNPTVAATQRDYIAGEVSKDISKRLLLPKAVVDAHEKGLIHFHDMDYYIQKIFNCCLINLEDMLQNGTVIAGNYISKPKSFLTACTIATQISAAVASNQYGGQTITLSHLAPFIDVSRQKIRKDMIENGVQKVMTEKAFDELVEKEVRREVKSGVQTIQYQVSTIATSNGQSPFISLFLYLNEVPEGRIRDDLAMLIEEVLEQRIKGVQNYAGMWVSPAFPKLIYVLQEDNIKEGSKYWWLTELAAKCTAKRLVPDYISEKKMFEYKVDDNGNGHCYPCMGCVVGDEVIAYKFRNQLHVESFKRMWYRLMPYFNVAVQPGRTSDLYMDLHDVEIFDNVKGWTECKRIIKNKDSKILNVKLSNGRCLRCTPDHPFETENRGVVHAQDLAETDIIRIDKTCDFACDEVKYDDVLAWMYGFMLCDSSYAGSIFASVAAVGEDDIANRFINAMKDKFGLDVTVKLQEREKKGTYKDLVVRGDWDGRVPFLVNSLVSMFGGTKKMDRHIPSEVFTWNREARLSFLAGIVDADGYVNDNGKIVSVQVGSTNKELAIQEMYLAQSIGYRASIYQNHYKGEGRGDTIRYMVMFDATSELMDRLACQKKVSKFKLTVRKDSPVYNKDFSSPTEVSEVANLEDTYDVTTASEHFTVSGIYSHNCRSFLTVPRGDVPRDKFYGRFNCGVVSVNLPDIALSSKGDMDRFWKIFDERMGLCHVALQSRHKRLRGVLSDTSPIHWQNGAIARLKKGETIDKLLFGGYSTLSLGYIGLWECVYAMTHKKLTETEGEKFGISVMSKLNEYTNKWKAEENIDYSLYGTPSESLCYRFAKTTRKRFGIIEGVTDRNYQTNSYHIHVTEKVDAFTKLATESKFQRLSPGGAISYVEIPNMQNNIPAVLSIMKFIYDNIQYAELNTKSDVCNVCGFDGEIKIVKDDNGKHVWECPKCGNRDQSKMSVVRRTCGYCGSQFWNEGKTQEIAERVLHCD